MRYDPQKHNRKSIRLKGYDYTNPGAYFVTLCIKNRECLLGEIRNREMILNDFGNIIAYHWKNIPTHFQNAKLDEFVVMPNHFHGILWLVGDDDINCWVEAFLAINSRKHYNLARNASTQHHPKTPERPKGTKPRSLSAIIQNFSSVTTRKINRIRKTPGKKLWQRNFYERIIRNEYELYNVRRYILNNVLKWELDSARPGNRNPQ